MNIIHPFTCELAVLVEPWRLSSFFREIPENQARKKAPIARLFVDAAAIVTPG
jgi:hypothetical protein